MAEPRYPSRCVERFLDYVTYDTQSREDADTYPSTAGQLVLLRKLAEELRELGLEDATLDDNGYVFATVPATTQKKDVPTIGFIAHVDTSPEMSGAGVKPILHENYDGGDLQLPDAADAVIRAAENPALAEQVGNTIVTASGTTLLGADNKAGVAEIMGAVEVWMARPDIPHGPIRVGFTPDEEVGQGTRFFDVDTFGAVAAYTVDGETLGEYQDETFSADTVILTFRGANTHPGFAKGKMVNAIKLAGRFLAELPADRLAPETTAGHEGFVHPYVVEGGVERTTLKILIRDFETAKLKEMERDLRRRAEAVVAGDPRAAFDFEVVESYRNMKEVLDRHPHVVESARRAIERAGLKPRKVAIRGGTDGSRLCFMGLPTPNIFAGEHNFHSRLEWVSTYDMHKAVETIVEIARVWEENAGS